MMPANTARSLSWQLVLDWLSPAAGAWERSPSAEAGPCSRALIVSTRMDFPSKSQQKAATWAD